jgi:hypothetical protein
MKNKLTKFELRKIISERMLLLEVEADTFNIDDKIKNEEEENKFRRWFIANELYEAFKNKVLNKSKYKDTKIDPEVSGNIKNIYIKAAWNFKENEDNKTVGQIYIESLESTEKAVGEVKAGIEDINNMKNFNWDNLLSVVKGLGARGDQIGAEALVLLCAKWHCSTVEGEGENAILKTDPVKWGKVKNEIGSYLNVAKDAEDKFLKMEKKPNNLESESQKVTKKSPKANTDIVDKKLAEYVSNSTVAV